MHLFSLGKPQEFPVVFSYIQPQPWLLDVSLYKPGTQ
jgi:hypothetical protein